jgi:hypothetical protein
VSNAGPAQLLREESRYADIVFSPDYAIDLLPPHLLAISRERVYRVADPDDLARRAREMTAALEEPFRICLLFTRPMTEPWRPLVRGLRPARRANARLFCGVRPEAPAPGAAAPPR